MVGACKKGEDGLRMIDWFIKRYGLVGACKKEEDGLRMVGWFIKKILIGLSM